ncbi:MAG: hypothetical protein K5894_11300 [Lachnospiraceae bacterium]|nr:hypothetical protein [Lachnospiraceae bacterium]
MGLTVSAISNNTMEMKLMKAMASGKKINKAADDPSGQAIASKLETAQRTAEAEAENDTLTQAMYNVKDGALSGMNDYLYSLSANAVRQGNDLYTSEDQSYIAMDSQASTDGVSALASTTTFNEQSVFNSDEIDTSSVDSIASSVASSRTSTGASYNALSHRISYNSNYAINAASSKSKVEDTEYGSTTSNLKAQQTLRTAKYQMQKKKEEQEEKRVKNMFSVA